MAILKKVEIHFTKLDPKRPNARFNKKQPTWELQMQTRSREVRKEWEALGLGVKIVEPEDDSPIYYRANLRKRSIKADGSEATPVTVVNGSLEPIDPNTIGNGSIANIRIFQYEYKNDDGKAGIASVLMSVQLLKHIVYVPKPRDDDFEMEETETIMADPTYEHNEPSEEEDDGTDNIYFDGDAPKGSPSVKAKTKPSPQLDPGGDY